MTSYSRILRLLSIATLLCTITAADMQAADSKGVKPRKEYRGHQKNAALFKKGKKFYASEKGFAEMWRAWHKGEPPKVDFSKELVITATCGGMNTPNAFVSLTEDGNLRWGAACTKRGGPGFGYWIGIVSRDGVKKVNGEDLPSPAEKPEAK